MPVPVLEVGDRPFNAAARDANRSAEPKVEPPSVPGSTPAQPSPTVMSAFGLPSTPVPGALNAPVQPSNSLFAGAGIVAPQPTPPPSPVTPTNVDANGKQIVENYSAVIQRHAEEAYATSLVRAKQDPSVIDTMLASDLKEEKSIAEKLLARNPELFGAGTAEEYQAKKQLEAAGDDPRDKEIAQLRLNQAKIDQKQNDRDWRDWKKENGVKDDSFGQMCDSVRKQHPMLPEGDIVAIARGRVGIKPLEPSPLDGVHVAPTGGRGSPSEGGKQPNSGALQAMRLGANEVTAAESYFEAVGSNLRGR